MSGTTFCVRVGTTQDLPAILEVQREAFSRVADELGIDPSQLPPLAEQLDDLIELLIGGTTFLVAADSAGAVIGSVRAARCGASVEVGRLVVGDRWTRRGVATALMDALEASHTDATSFELFTGAEAGAPLALYQQRGYLETRRERTGPVELVWLRKYPVSHD